MPWTGGWTRPPGRSKTSAASLPRGDGHGHSWPEADLGLGGESMSRQAAGFWSACIPRFAAHCTLALTDALPLIVNVQLLVLLPPLEQAPDQITSRPFEALSEIDVPVANAAEPLPPTATLIPAGLDVIRSPLRPVVLTVRVALAPGGLIVSVAVLATPPSPAEMVAAVTAVTGLVVTVKLAPLAPAGTVTLAGTAAAAELSDSITSDPPAGAGPVNLTLPWDVPPPVKLPGSSVNVSRLAGGAGAGTGVTVSEPVRLVPL